MWWWLHKSLNLLRIIQLYTYNGSIFWLLSSTLRKLLNNQTHTFIKKFLIWSKPGKFYSVYVLTRFCCIRLFETPWTAAHQAPLSMGFSRQGYWSGSPCPPPGDLPDPGIEPLSLMSPALAGGFFTYLCHLGTPYTNYVSIKDIS